MWQDRRSNREEKRSAADHRTPYERDRTRLIHCAAFRRLQRKTQILGTREGDFHRTRLTHSLEVDSIARSLVRNLHYQHQNKKLFFPWLSHLPDDDLIAVIALSHDIGHPPFGHGGEAALNYWMRDYGGFESNGQTLRLLTSLEESHAPFGLDFTRRTLLGVLKYPTPYSKVKDFSNITQKKLNLAKNIPSLFPPKCYLDDEQPVVDWILEAFNEKDKALFQTLSSEHKTLYHSLDCSIMNIADDIAYGVHDLEDAIYLGLVSRDEFQAWEDKNHRKLSDLWSKTTFSKDSVLSSTHHFFDQLFHVDIAKRKQAIGRMVNIFITSVEIHEPDSDFKEPLLHYNVRLSKNISPILEYLKDFVFDRVINSFDAQTTEHGGQVVISHLFEALSSNPEQLLTASYRTQYCKAVTEKGVNAGMRIICDYIASMTDDCAYKLHKRLFGLGV